MVFCMAAFFNGMIGFAFAPIAKSASLYYGVSYNGINQLAVVSLLCPFITYIPAIWIADRNRFEVPFYIAMMMSVSLRWIRYSFDSPDATGYAVVLSTTVASAMVAPCLSCLAPVLSRNYFPKHQQGIATSLGTLFGLIGTGSGIVISPLYQDDIHSLLYFHAVSLSIPFILSIFCLDLCYWCVEEEEEYPRTTSFRRVVRSLSQISSPGSALEPSLEPSLEEPLISHHFYDLPLSVCYNFPVENLNDIPEQHVHSFRDTFVRLFSDVLFLRLLLGISLTSGVINAIMTLVNEAAPPSLDNATGAQLVASLFFGCGAIGAVVTGITMDKTRHYIRISRICISLATPFTGLAMYGWRYDVASYVLVGIGGTGLFGLGLFPLAIELAIKYSYSEDFSNAGATIAGVIQCVSNIVSIVIIAVTTPGNLLESQDIPIVWMVINIVGGALLFTLPSPL